MPPEVWRGLGVWHSTDVWSFGITIGWDLSLLMFVGPIEAPVNSKYEEEFALAGYLVTSTFKHQDESLERQFVTVGTLRHSGELHEIYHWNNALTACHFILSLYCQIPTLCLSVVDRIRSGLSNMLFRTHRAVAAFSPLHALRRCQSSIPAAMF